MSENKGEAAPLLDGVEAANKAIARLAIRIAKLEADAPAVSGAVGDGKDLRPFLAATCNGLKELKTMFVTACSEVDGRFKELENVKVENEKLKYQVKHLKRSLETEEARIK